MADEKKERRPRGPEPDRLKIEEGDWEQAVRKALHKKPAAAKRPRKRKRR